MFDFKKNIQICSSMGLMMSPEELEEIMSRVPLFRNLNSSERAAISAVMITREYDAGDSIVLEEDEESQTFFVIARGAVNVTVLTSEGKQTILATLRKGEFFGEMAILDGEPRSASVIAAENCLLLMLYRRPFLEILQK